MVVQESTLYLNVSPAARVFVQPVRVVSWALTALEMVGFAEAVIVSATVGG
jgi:hypothetical protein